VDTIARIKLPDFIGEVRKVLRVIEHLLTCAQARLLHDQIAKCMKDPVCASQWSDAERQEMEDLLLETEVVLQDSCPSIFHPWAMLLPAHRADQHGYHRAEGWRPTIKAE
jgi:hypothetical protein